MENCWAKRFSFIFVFGFLCSWLHTYELTREGDTLVVCMEYGRAVITEPVLIELIESQPMQRLKKIRQYGVVYYARGVEDFNRFEHSLGVFLLLRLYGASLEEQVAGLLHDVSHTIFSHVGDFLFRGDHDKESYQDKIHEWYLERSGLAAVLRAHGMDGVCTHEAKQQQRMLEQALPDLCADRIEYNLRGALVEGWITEEDVAEMLAHLHFFDGTWFFDAVKPAQLFAGISVRLSQEIWGAPWNGFIYDRAAHALQHALKIGIITEDAVHFSEDDLVWQTLQQRGDATVKALLEVIVDCRNHHVVTESADYDLFVNRKFSGTNPWVMVHNTLIRLKDIDPHYADQYDSVKERITRGWRIKFV